MLSVWMLTSLKSCPKARPMALPRAIHDAALPRLKPGAQSRLQRCGVWLTSQATRSGMPMGVSRAAADCPLLRARQIAGQDCSGGRTRIHRTRTSWTPESGLDR